MKKTIDIFVDIQSRILFCNYEPRFLKMRMNNACKGKTKYYSREIEKIGRKNIFSNSRRVHMIRL
jgi:hypothetical protein